MVFPSEEGDGTGVLQIKYPDRYNVRKERIHKIKKWMEKCGLSVRKERRMLKFVFPDVNETVDFFCNGF